MRRALWLVVGACLWISGAAQAGTQPVEHLGTDEGAVALTVTVDFPSGSGFGPGMSGVVSVQRADEPRGKVFFLESRGQGLRSSRVYAGSLPAGRYRIHDFFSQVCYVLCPGPTAPAPEGMPDFTVVSDNVTLLGNIAYSTRVSDAKPGWTRYWGWEDQPDADVARRVFANVYPELASHPTRIGWADGAAAVGAEKLREMKSNSGGFYQPSPLGADGFVFGAQLGVVKVWNPRLGGVGLLDTGSVFAVRSVLADAVGGILAAGEAGTLVHSRDGGHSWQDASHGLPYGVVMQLVRAGDDSVLVLVVLNESVAVFRGPFDGSNWERLAEFPVKFSFWTGVPGLLPQLFVQGQDAIVSLPSKRAAHLRLDTGESRMFDMPGGIQAMSFTADGVLRCRCARTLAVNPWESRDLGRTWQGADLNRFMMLPIFKNGTEGFAYQGAIFSAEKAGVVVTHDAGRTWVRTPGVGFAGDWTPAYSADGNAMLLAGSLNLVTSVTDTALLSEDGGTTWKPIGLRRGWLGPAWQAQEFDQAPSPSGTR